MAELQLASDFNIWYRLYADDLVFIVSHEHIEELINNLLRISTKYSLQVNKKKSAIFLIKGHDKIAESEIEGIPIQKTYNYLGVTIDHNGSLDTQLDKIVQRSNYLRSNMRYYTHTTSDSITNTYSGPFTAALTSPTQAR